MKFKSFYFNYIKLIFSDKVCWHVAHASGIFQNRAIVLYLVSNKKFIRKIEIEIEYICYIYIIKKNPFAGNRKIVVLQPENCGYQKRIFFHRSGSCKLYTVIQDPDVPNKYDFCYLIQKFLVKKGVFVRFKSFEAISGHQDAHFRVY